MIGRFFNSSFTVKRLANTTGAKQADTIIGVISGMLQPVSAAAANADHLAFARQFVIYIAHGSIVQIGDKLVDNSTGNVYQVQGAKNNGFGSQPYTELQVQLEIAEGQI